MEALEIEISIMAYLKTCYRGGHPNLVRLEDCSEMDADKSFLVMEYCLGGDLFSFIQKSGGKLEEGMARKAMVALMTGIQACHAQGIMHGDIKPEDALLDVDITRESEKSSISLKLCDFGLATYLMAGETCSDVVGTSMYMAPEVFIGRRGPEADIWAAGVTLHFMLSGQFPFPGKTMEEVRVQ